MKVFISSLISGMAPIRNAAREAVTALGHEPTMAEDFVARAQSPQLACLQGVREADVVVLILGDRYGAPQTSEISATHEEYREAQGRKPILAFVQDGDTRESEQTKFVAEVQGWENGFFRAGFSDAADLQPKITRALHEWQLANATAPLDPHELLSRALTLLPPERRNLHSSGTSLFVAVVGGPTQPILRPAEIENETFAQKLLEMALFGERRIFDPARGSHVKVDGANLVLYQDRDAAMLTIDESGAVLLKLSIERSGDVHTLPVLVEEDVQRQLACALAYAAWVLEHVDRTQRLTHVVVATKIVGGEFLEWRTRGEHGASPNRMGMCLGNDERRAVHLTPPHRARAALRLEAGRLLEDLVVMLRRQWKS